LVLIATFVVAFSTGFWLAGRIFNLALLILPVAYLWPRVTLAGLQIEVSRPAERLQEGSDYEERVTLTNKSFFTKLWLEVEDPSDMPGHAVRRVISLPPRATRSWRAVSRCGRRGLYSIGPVRVTSKDLFGLFQHTREFGSPKSVLVYPRAVELTNLAVPSAVLPGEGRHRRPTQQITPNAAGVREYQPGDSLNRFHWRSTARTGELMVKLFELDPASDVWIVLDLHRDVQSGEGDDGTEEYAVRIAASVARYFLTANRNVGLLAHGHRYYIEEATRGLGQYTRILEALAVARAHGEVPLADLLNHEGRRFGRHTTLVVITPSADESWVVSLQLLAGHGVKLAAILLEPRTFGGEGNALLVYSALAALDLPTYLVKQSDDISEALSASAVAAEGARA
jgi:uncharacterized protein (DUF58 family)